MSAEGTEIVVPRGGTMESQAAASYDFLCY